MPLESDCGHGTEVCNWYDSFIEFYYVTGSEGAWVQGEQIEFTGDELSQTAFVTVTLNISDYCRIGIRASNAYIDNFTASQANIIPEKKITTLFPQLLNRFMSSILIINPSS